LLRITGDSAPTSARREATPCRRNTAVFEIEKYNDAGVAAILGGCARGIWSA
jgi:hypothetical protein